MIVTIVPMVWIILLPCYKRNKKDFASVLRKNWVAKDRWKIKLPFYLSRIVFSAHIFLSYIGIFCVLYLFSRCSIFEKHRESKEITAEIITAP